MSPNPQQQALSKSILEIQVNAALSGHDLAPFERVTDRATGGYQVRCRRCGQDRRAGSARMGCSIVCWMRRASRY